MFWNYNYMATSRIESLLSKEDVTLKQLMDEEEIIQECKAQTHTLIDFLVRPEIIEELVSLIVEEPSVDVEDGVRYKYSNIACELLTCDVPVINEKIAAEEKLLKKLYGFLQNEPPLNPLLASFFSKTLGILFAARKTEQNWYSYQLTCLQVMEFLKAREDFIPLLLKHLGTSAIMDLMLRIVNSVQGDDNRKNVLTWLDGLDLIGQIVSSIQASVEADIQVNASQLLCDMIKWNREAMYLQSQGEEKLTPDPLLNNIESTETVKKLLDNILGPVKSETSIVGGISVLLSLLDFRKPGAQQQLNQAASNGEEEDASREKEKSEEEQQQKQLESNVLQAIIPRLQDFTLLLSEPPQKPPVRLNIGTIDPPFGATRLHIVKLIAVLVSTNSSEVNEELARLNTFQVLLDLFFKYTWNNFLHTQVEKTLLSLLQNVPEPECTKTEETCPLLVNVFTKCHLLQRLLDGWEENEQEQSKECGHRRGYMGHIINMCNHVVECLEREDAVGELIKGYVADLVEPYPVRWEQLRTHLEEVKNKKYTAKVEVITTTGPSSEADDADYCSQVYPPEEPALEQAFAEYAAQQGVQPCSEQFGFSDHQFNEDTISGPLERLSTTTHSFDLTDEEPQQALYERIAGEKLSTLPHSFDLTDEDPQQALFERIAGEKLSMSLDWEGKGITFTSSKNDIKMEGPESSSESSGNNSSDEEDEKEGKQKVWPSDRPPSNDVEMDCDPWSNNALEVGSAPVAMDTGNPWESSTNGNQVEGGWADFDAFQQSSSTTPDNWADFSQCPSPQAVAKPNEDTPAPDSSTTQQDSSMDEVESPREDLEENFRFLASQRLLQKSSNNENVDASSNGSLESHTSSECKLKPEETESSVPNGPV